MLTFRRNGGTLYSVPRQRPKQYRPCATEAVSARDAAWDTQAAHRDELAEVISHDRCAARSEREHLRRVFSRLETPPLTFGAGRRTATQANCTDISPEATGKNGLFTLSMLMS